MPFTPRGSEPGATTPKNTAMLITGECDVLVCVSVCVVKCLYMFNLYFSVDLKNYGKSAYLPLAGVS